MQGDGNARNIETTLTDSDNIPTSSAVKKLKVGGRNLLRGTKDMPIGTGKWYTSTWRQSGSGTIANTTISNSPVAGCTRGIKITPSGTSCGIAQDSFRQTTSSETGVVSFRAGDTLCFSAWIKPSAAGVTCRIHAFNDNARSTDPLDGMGEKSFTLVAGWQRVWYSGTKAHDSTYTTGDSLGYIFCTTAGASIEVCCPKLEFGEIPTDWTPALEDVGCTTDIIDTTGTYTYSSDGNTMSVTDITMYGRLNLLSTKGDTVVGGVIQFGDGATYRNYIGEGVVDDDGNFIPDDADILVIGGDVDFVGCEGSYPVINLGPTNTN